MSGYKVVPVEPTRAMIDAAAGCVTKPDDLPSIGEGWTMSDLAFRTRYMAAIAAAPAVQGEPVAYTLEDDIYFEGGGEINDYIRSNGQPLYAAPQPAEQSACPVCHGEGLNPLTEVPVPCANCHGAQPAEPQPAAKFKLGDHVRKIKGSQWKGRVVGTYSTSLTPEGYAVESDTEKGSVQIYPVGALELMGEES